MLLLSMYGVMLSGGLAKGRWVVLGMVIEGGDSSSDITSLRKSQGLVKNHSYFMQAVCTFLWMVVTYSDGNNGVINKRRY